jgi:hypothetical protein
MPRKPWVPHPDEAKFFHHIYIDESSQNDHDYMVIGGIVIPMAFAKKLEEEIENAKPPYWRGRGKKGHPREVGWKFISNGSYERYRKIVEAYADFSYRHVGSTKNAGITQMFYSVVNLNVRGRRYTGNARASIAFERELYFHCLSIDRRDRRYLWHIYPDDRSTKSKGYKLATIISRGMAKHGNHKPWPARRLSYRNSYDLQALQISDIVAGAIAFYLNGSYHKPNANKDKKQLCDYIFDRFKLCGYIDQKREKGFGPLILWFREHQDRPMSRHPRPAKADHEN